MNRRKALIAVALLIVVASAYLVTRHLRLGTYRAQIERDFDDELALIEQKAREFPADEYDPSRFDWIDDVKVLFERELSDPAIYWASWSLDGHHGLMGLKSSGDGLSHPQWFPNRNDDGSRSVAYGTTFDGRPLVVLHGYNRDAVKRHYMVAFLRNVIDETNR